MDVLEELTWRRGPPDGEGYWLRFDDHLTHEDGREKVKVTLHFTMSMRDGRVLVNLGVDLPGPGGQPNYTDVTSPTVVSRTSHWWWYGPIPILPPDC